MEEELFTPFLNCGWKHPVDGCCSHPNNATPECHQFCCPIKAAQHGVQSDLALTCQACTEKPATVHYCNDCYFGNEPSR